MGSKLLKHQRNTSLSVEALASSFLVDILTQHHSQNPIASMKCCCCCQVASVVSNSVRPHRQQPIRLLCPWDSPGKNTGVGCHFLLQCMKVKSESEVAQSCPTLRDPMDCSLPGSSAHGFSRQEYWSGLPLPYPLQYSGLENSIDCVVPGVAESDTAERLSHGRLSPASSNPFSGTGCSFNALASAV